MSFFCRVIYIQNAPEKPALVVDSGKLPPSSKSEISTQVYSCHKSHSTNINIPSSHSLLPPSENLSKDEGSKYTDIKYKTLEVFSTHYSLNLGCDKNEAIKTGEKEKSAAAAAVKKEVDASSDEGETYGLLNI